MGVEIEVEHTPDNDNGWDRDESTEEALLEMHSYTHYIDDTDSRLRQLVIAKVDGSLDHGVEFVTQPMTLRAHNKINYDALQGKGFYAWNAGTAGLHVHVPTPHQQMSSDTNIGRRRGMALTPHVLDHVQHGSLDLSPKTHPNRFEKHAIAFSRLN